MEIFSFSAKILSRRGLTHHGWGWLAQSWGSLLLTDRESWMPAMLCLGSVAQWSGIILSPLSGQSLCLGIRQSEYKIIACNHNPEVSSSKCYQ